MGRFSTQGTAVGAARRCYAFGIALLCSLAIAGPATAAPTATAVSAGGSHTCAVLSGGAVMCWGADFFGQLGVGGDNAPETCIVLPCSTSPVPVTGLGAGVTAVSAGGEHVCALTGGGAVWCWGYASSGQLGDGTLWVHGYSPTPVAVSGLGGGVTAIAAGGEHTCALKSTGAVLCWGANTFGQLGDGTTADRRTPVAVRGLGSGVVAIAAGGYHTCALTGGGAVRCWGHDLDGQLGDGTTTGPDSCGGAACATTPIAVRGLDSGVAAITAGRSHTCAVTASGGALCWGFGGVGMLGHGNDANSSVPVGVVGLDRGVMAIDAGTGNTCALLSGGAVRCWGSNFFGQLGDGSGANSSVPVAVSGLGSGVTAVTADDQSCAVLRGGAVRCWGWNAYGQVGDGTTTNRPTPVAVGFPGIPTGLTAAPQLVLFPPPVGVGLGTVSATLTSSGAPLAGRTIAFSVSGLPLCIAVTRSDGTATCRLGFLAELFVLLANGYSARFAGDATYLPSTAGTPAITLGLLGAAHQASADAQHRDMWIVRGTITRGRTRYAVTVRRGDAGLRFAALRRLRPGRYTLTAKLTGGREVRRTITLGRR